MCSAKRAEQVKVSLCVPQQTHVGHQQEGFDMGFMWTILDQCVHCMVAVTSSCFSCVSHFPCFVRSQVAVRRRRKKTKYQWPTLIAVFIYFHTVYQLQNLFSLDRVIIERGLGNRIWTPLRKRVNRSGSSGRIWVLASDEEKDCQTMGRTSNISNNFFANAQRRCRLQVCFSFQA